VPDVSLPAHIAWAEGLPLADSLRPFLNGATSETRDQAGIAEDLRMRATYTDAPPVSSNLPFSYQAVPGPLRRILARGIGLLQRSRQNKWARYPGWPLDLSADIAADLFGLPSITFARTPVMLTHDIDSQEGLRNLYDMFLPIEEALGMRSANYVVPSAWPIDAGLAGSVRDRGHEIGVHGYNHANRTPFVSQTERLERLKAGRAFADLYGGAGYRAPSLLRTRALIESLKAFYRYDTSIPTSGGAFPVPNNGCATARPWRFGPMWELPLSMPRDGSLRFLGHSPAEIGEMWRRTALRIQASGGTVNLLTHCETGFSGNTAMLRIYRAFLEWIAADTRFEVMLPVSLVDRLDRDWPAPPHH
jgi:peptidoglycan/xylan/chitin deacetylase (PgdA/CDA1 family)